LKVYKEKTREGIDGRRRKKENKKNKKKGNRLVISAGCSTRNLPTREGPPEYNNSTSAKKKLIDGEKV